MVADDPRDDNTVTRTWKTCATCRGEGIVLLHYGRSFFCWRCRGRGKVEIVTIKSWPSFGEVDP